MSKPNITAWAAKPHSIHRRDIGAFSLFACADSDGWAWSVEWGDNILEDGRIYLTRADNDSPDCYAASLPRAKAACEGAARKAGIAVPT